MKKSSDRKIVSDSGWLKLEHSRARLRETPADRSQGIISRFTDLAHGKVMDAEVAAEFGVEPTSTAIAVSVYKPVHRSFVVEYACEPQPAKRFLQRHRASMSYLFKLGGDPCSALPGYQDLKPGPVGPLY